VSTTESTQRESRPSPQLIRSEGQYDAALAYIDTLMSAEPETPQMEELDLWVHLVQKYEEEKYPIPSPSPVAAIRFRMEQQGLTPSDLVPYMGSKSKVSEVLSGKRSLSLAMIRKLHAGLGIPAEVLIAAGQVQGPDGRFDAVDWKAFPLAAIAKRGWFGAPVRTAKDLLAHAEELLGGLLSATEVACPGPGALRQSASANSLESQPALRAWRARVWQLARSARSEVAVAGAVDGSLISEVARLSVLEDGPLVARRVLAKAGIVLVVEPQLPSTRLDGGVMRCADGGVVIGLTLRYDRLDHFWFTLCHELAHLVLHLRAGDCAAILDDLEAEERSELERDADDLAADALIPSERWAEFSASSRITEPEVRAFARAVRVHPSVVAGRLRRERADYSKFGSLLGHRAVRALFLGAASAE
jgi:HTH-type transcriptional regulator/antitoxin HigA